jgi:hypothetical protein
MGVARRGGDRGLGVTAGKVNGIVTAVLAETALFAPATLAEYLGIAVNFGEYVDLGGATAAGHDLAGGRRVRNKNAFYSTSACVHTSPPMPAIVNVRRDILLLEHVLEIC